MPTFAQPVCTSSIELVSTEQLKRAWLASEKITFGDPILAHIALPFEKTYYPLGLPVSVATNSQMVLEAADQSWGAFELLFDRPPVRLEIGVSAGDSPFCPPTPVCRMRNDLMTSIADGKNFSINDLAEGRSMMWVTDAALQYTDYFRYFFLESAAMSQISGRYATGIHAACVAHRGRGFLLCGDSGAGKSTLAYGCARSGWTYITDDGSYLINGSPGRLVAGNCSQIRFRPSAVAVFPELHGLPTVQRAGAGKPSMEFSVHSSPRLSISATANIETIVFLKRNVTTQEVGAFPRAVARLYMEQRAHCIPYQTTEQMDSIDRLLEAEVCELRYNELDWAIRKLSQLATGDYRNEDRT